MPQMSTANDLRQRRQKPVASDLQSAASDAGMENAGNSCKSSPSVSATRSMWVHRVKLCVSLALILISAWVYASYIKQLHETHLWFSNIQVRQLTALVHLFV